VLKLSRSFWGNGERIYVLYAFKWQIEHMYLFMITIVRLSDTYTDYF